VGLSKTLAEPVAAIVPGYGLADVLPHALGGIPGAAAVLINGWIRSARLRGNGHKSLPIGEISIAYPWQLLAPRNWLTAEHKSDFTYP
jgi:hypothetical protein